MKDKIYSWFLDHKGEMIEDICTLVRIPSIQSSPSSVYPFGEDCFNALEKSIEIAERLGLKTHIYKNAVGQASLNEGYVDFGIWAHSDVVPVDGQWTTPPFDPVVRDGRIYGRGTTDNKGPLITSLYVLRCLRELGIELKHNVGVFVGTNEETGMFDVKEWLSENKEPFFNLAPDAIYTTGYAEKGVLRFFMSAVLDQKGLIDIQGGSALNIFPKEATAVLALDQINADALSKLRNIECSIDGNTVKLVARGRGGHSARALGIDNPYLKLINAMDKSCIFEEGMSPQLRFIADACSDESGSFLGVKCRDYVVGDLHFAGTVLRFVDGIVSLGCDIRHPMSETSEELIDRIRNVCAASGFRVLIEEINGSIYSNPNEAGSLACASIYNELACEFGCEKGKQYTLSGGTYARHFTRGYAFGIDAGANEHNADEYVVIDNLIFGGLVYALCLMELDKIY